MNVPRTSFFLLYIPNVIQYFAPTLSIFPFPITSREKLLPSQHKTNFSLFPLTAGSNKNHRNKILSSDGLTYFPGTVFLDFAVFLVLIVVLVSQIRVGDAIQDGVLVSSGNHCGNGGGCDRRWVLPRVAATIGRYL